MAKLRKHYSADFKRKIVLMSFEDRPCKELCEEYDIHPNLLSRWRRQYADLGERSFPGHGNEALSDEQKQIRRLEKELKAAREEREILKKAIRIFSSTDGKNMGS